MWVCHNIPEITMVYVTYVCVCTGECQWGDLPLIKKMMTACHSLFPVVRYSFTTIPSYCGGQVGFVLASLNKVRGVCVCMWLLTLPSCFPTHYYISLASLFLLSQLQFYSSFSQDTVFEEPIRRLSEEEQEEMGLQYYDSDVHKAAFTLPRFARKVDTYIYIVAKQWKVSLERIIMHKQAVLMGILSQYNIYQFRKGPKGPPCLLQLTCV